MIKDINRSNPRAYIKQDSDEDYTIIVHFDACDTKGYQVSLRPLLSKRSECFGEDIQFTRLMMTQLSEFYVLSASNGMQTIERVIIILTDGLPEARERAVVSSIVSDRDCFYRYIAFLLGDDAILSMLEANTAVGNNNGAVNRQSYHVPALYEKMLQTAAVAPDKFKGIEYLMKTISEDGIIPEDFKKLYETFKKAVKLNG